MEVPKEVRLIRLECGKANAIDLRLLKTLSDALEAARADSCRAVVVTGYEQFFSAGLNLKSLPDSREGDDGLRSRVRERTASLAHFPASGGCRYQWACHCRGMRFCFGM